MTNTPKLAIAIGYIDDDLVTSAIEYDQINTMNIRRRQICRRPAFMRNWSRLGVTVACLCFVLVLSGFAVLAMSLSDNLPAIDSSDIKYEENEHSNIGIYSTTDAFDVFGSFEPNGTLSGKSSTEDLYSFSLDKGESKTLSITASNGQFTAEQDIIELAITSQGNVLFQYICEDVTDKKELANFSSTENINRVLSNLNPEHKYEVTVINLGITDLTLNISINSHHYGCGEIILK